MQQIEDWLKGLGLGEYVQRFTENGIDLSVLSDLTDQDLKDLGVLLGHRRKMQRAIAQLRGARKRHASSLTRAGAGRSRRAEPANCDVLRYRRIDRPFGQHGS
jgi:hypothetical protein